MSSRLDVAEAITKPCNGKVFIGWDGNTDEILDVVETRGGADEYKAMETMDILGMRIVKAAGKSCNIELIPKQTKVGGNGPILAKALLEGGHEITLVGTLGDPEIEPLFDTFVKRCKRVVSFGPSAYTQALEFADGKIMLGKLEVFKQITWDHLLQKIPLDELVAIFEELDLFVSANWTMLLGINGVWNGILTQVMPKLSKKTRWMFVDLADPAKRTDEDILASLDLLRGLAQGFKVVLGLNHSEEGRVAKVLGVFEPGEARENVAHMAQKIREKLDLAHVVCHSTHYAIAADTGGTYPCDGPYVGKPKLATGAGDNFNSGYCNGLLRGLSTRECVVLGVATSGFYVREAHSPSMIELAEFLKVWQAGKLGEDP